MEANENEAAQPPRSSDLVFPMQIEGIKESDQLRHPVCYIPDCCDHRQRYAACESVLCSVINGARNMRSSAASIKPH